MIVSSSRTFKVLASILCVLSLIPTSCHGLKSPTHLPLQSSAHQQKPDVFLQHPVSRVGFDKDQLSNEPIVLLQEDGIVDYVKVLFFNLPPGLTEDDVEFSQSTSDPMVLNVTSNSNANLALPPSGAAGATLNVTANVLFDGMAGVVRYTLVAINKKTQEQLDFVSLLFRICGITLYRELPSGEIEVVSGESNKLMVTYQEAMSKTMVWQKYVKCFIQYADGRTSTSFVNMNDNNFKLPDGNSLSMQVENMKGEITHDTSMCPVSSVGSKTVSGNPVLPFGCGCGFYFGISSDLAFGYLFNDFRVGTFQLHFTWPGLLANYPPLAGMGYELTCNIVVTGAPPLIVVGIEPFDNVLRQEGGQIRTLKMINVEMNDAIMFEVRVLGLTRPFKMIPDSFVKASAPDFVDQISVVTEPGSGSDLTWSCYYQTVNGSRDGDEYQEAMFVSSFLHSFTFDSDRLRIDKLDPEFAFEDGTMSGENGTEPQLCTITGYFPYFNPEVDSIQFSGYRIPSMYIVSVKTWEITFRLPPRSEIGSSFDYAVTAHIGYAKSNSVTFSYYVTNPLISFRMIGLNMVAENTYRLGDCSYTTLTVNVSPFTSQVLGFSWFLFSVSNSTGFNLLEDKSMFHTANMTAQSITIESEMIPVGTYILRAEVRLLKGSIESEILLVREPMLAVGVTILPIANQTLKTLSSVVRFIAVVTEPTCLFADGQLAFEWEAFGKKHVYTPQNATAVRAPISDEEVVTRLGWELVVPRETVVVGTHDVSFRAYVIGNETIEGNAATKLQVEHAPLLSVIRNGEQNLDVNPATTLQLYANNSYDADVPDDKRYDGLTYEWSCVVSVSPTFSSAETAPCPDSMLPDPKAMAFTVSMDFLSVRTSLHYIQYSLVTRKGSGRVSPMSSLLLRVVHGGAKPYLTDYTISLTDAEGGFMCMNATEYYKDVILHVDALGVGVTDAQGAENNGTTWTFELVQPVDLGFFSAANIYDHDSYYSPPATIIQSVHGSRGEAKPLGIRAGALAPSTLYMFRATFYSATFAVTTVTFYIRTISSLQLYVSAPPLTAVSPGTPLGATAGVSSPDGALSYYFKLRDTSGYEYCAGGCTGADTTFFAPSRPAKYTLHATVCDGTGRVIASADGAWPFFVTSPGNNDGDNGPEIPSGPGDEDNNSTVDYAAEANRYAAELAAHWGIGNDQQWTQTAHDLVITLTAAGTSAGEAGRLEIAGALANDTRSLYCNTFPSAEHGQDCIQLLYRVAQLSFVDTDMYYDIIATATCCVKRAPPHTILAVVQWLPSLISELARVARGLDQVGTSRRRLLQTAVTSGSSNPANALADLHTWTPEIMAHAAASGMQAGFAQEYAVSTGSSAAYVTVAVATQASDLTDTALNGVSRRVVGGPSSNEAFYARGECVGKVFGGDNERRVLAMLTVDNFVVLGFQDEPIQGNLNDRLYWTRVYAPGSEGNVALQDVDVSGEQFCFCWRLPVTRLRQQLQATVDIMPGLYGVMGDKAFGEDVTERGLVYNYDYAGAKTSDYNVTAGWVEGCRADVGLVGATVVSKSASNILDGGLSIIGFNAWAIVGLVVGGVMLVMVAIVSSWLVAARSVNEGVVAADEEAEHSVFVERDIYGRGTMFGGLLAKVKSKE